MQAPASALLLLGLMVSACSFGADPADGGPDLDAEPMADGDAGPADDGSQESDGSDPGPADLDPTPLPLGLADVVRIGQPGGVDIASAALVEADGSLVVVVERYDTEFTAGHLLEFSSQDGSAWLGPQTVALGAGTFSGSPTILTHSDGVWLYFAQSDGLYASVRLLRSRRGLDGWQTPEALMDVPGVTSLLSWPRFTKLEGERVGLAFRDGQGRPQVAFSEDGAVFEAPKSVAQESVAMVDLGDLADATLVCTYQTGSGGSMTSWARTSPDGQDWSAPVQVSQSSTNVHDTCPVRRMDGDVDLYYIWPCSAVGFCLFRRAMSADGTLGPEQEVTAAEVGETTKPAALRLPDGRLLVFWAEITRRGPGGEPTEQILAAARIAGDAPR